MQKKKTNKRGPAKGTKLAEVSRSKIGYRIFSARRSKGISQKELGEKTGLSLRRISYYERESDGLPAPVLSKIAGALNVTTSYLLGESPLKQPVDETPFSVRKMLEAYKRLPRADQKTVINTIRGLEAKNTLQKQGQPLATNG